MSAGPTTPVLLASPLDAPGHYLHWWIFDISVANLVVIAVMLVIFFAALLLPFPKERHPQEPAPVTPGPPTPSPGGWPDTTWTGRLRLAAVRYLPPDKLLPGRQPSYVDSWAYLFGIAALAALGVAVVSGLAIALGGVDWWHTNPVGHFFNSLHLWSVELFFAFLVIHLWVKFFMAAWRGKRARTWITGVLAFLASIVEAFTGYLSQQNFDSQWIATNGKDAFNAVGAGGFFNLMNFGQMLLWHGVLMPLILIAFVGIHVLLVRHRGVAHPIPARRGRDPLGRRVADAPRHTRGELKVLETAEWQGPTRRYDLIREGVAATAVVLAATFAMAGTLSSPDVAPVTIQKWAQAGPADFLTIAGNELAGASETATYGPPYNNADAMVQQIVVSLQKAAGVRYRIDAARTFVLDPLATIAAENPTLAGALRSYQAAPRATQLKWDNAYVAALAKARFRGNTPVLPKGDYGPVPLMLQDELTMAQSGGLDASLLSQHPFYGTDNTKALLFLEDGTYFAAKAQADRLQGDQWGVMNETGSYPGQPWLWLYQLWYHVPGFSNSANVDLIAVGLTGLATLLLVLVPFLPGIRSIPKAVPLYRLIWRRYYREAEDAPAAPQQPKVKA